MAEQEPTGDDVRMIDTGPALWSDQPDESVSALTPEDGGDDESAPLPGIEQVPEYIPLSTRATAEAVEEFGEEALAGIPVDADYADDMEFWKGIVKAAKSVGKVLKHVPIDPGDVVSTVATTFGVPAPVTAAVQSFLRKKVLRRETRVEAEEDSEPSLLEVVIGADDRVRIRNTKVAPWSGICHLGITAANGQRFLGTGWLISPRCVITAGHCVYIRSAGGWAKSIQVTPGRDEAAAPFGRIDATRFSAMPQWVRANDRNFDCGCIILPRAMKAANGTAPFRFGYAVKSDAAIKARALNLSGYPGDKGGSTQWFHARMAKTVSAAVITYDVDTAGGQSGSPVWHLENGVRTAVGIHTNGSPLGNSATRITPTIKAQLDAWKAAAS